MNRPVPNHLRPPADDGVLYGRLNFDTDYWEIRDAGPAVLEMAKRVFPGCQWGGGRRSNVIRFRNTRRAVGELVWFMQRYPLQIDDVDRFEADRQRAILHARQRDSQHALRPAEPPAEFNGTLHPFQAEGTAFLLANRRSLCADEMGLGKTVEALATIASLRMFPVLIVAPANIQDQWRREAGRFLNIAGCAGDGLSHIIRGTKPGELPDRRIYIIHYGLLQYWRQRLVEMPFSVMIFDEIQDLRHATTNKYSAASELASRAEVVLGLSGTPIHNYGGEIWAVTNILDYHCLGDWESFTREWCEGYGQKIVSHPEILLDHLRREGLMIRRRKADVVHELPPKHRVVYDIEHDSARYAELIAKAVQLARGYGQITEWTRRGRVARLIEGYGRRAAGLSKVQAAVDFVRTLLQSGERPLVYAWHHDVHDALAEGLAAWPVAKITGRQSPREKQQAIKAFSQGQAQWVQLSLRAAAGLDGLQGRATCVVFVELDWSPAVHSQCEDRLHRFGISQLDSVACYYLVSNTTYDTVVRDALGMKAAQFAGLMGDTAETEQDRVFGEQMTSQHLQKVIDRLCA